MQSDTLYCRDMEETQKHDLFTTAAQLLLGAIVFLLFASYLALPCMTRDASQFQSVGAPNSCSQHDIFKPAADIPKMYQSLLAEASYRLPLTIIASTFGFVLLLVRLPGDERHRRRRRLPGIRLPFSTSDPPKLPAFAALRDA